MLSFGYARLLRRKWNGRKGVASKHSTFQSAKVQPSSDPLGRVSTDVNKLGTFTNTYVGVTNRLSKIAYPGGASANYTYFPNAQNKRLQQIKNLNSSKNNNLISQFDYTYDVEGEIATWTKNYAGLAAPQRFDLGYDNADQLTTAPLKNASTNALIKQYTYGYDPASNRTSETVATTTTTSTPNNVNEITSKSGGVNRTLTYDLNGSITSDGGTRTFEWDRANRLVAINYTGFTTRSEFTYDGMSRIVKIVEKTGSTINSTRKFVWHGQEKLEFRDATDAVTQRNYRQGQYVGTTAYFYTRDHLGSIREMFTGGGTVVARYDYDPYGRSTTVLGTTPTDFNFTGLYRHSKSNLDLAVYRAYDPDLGRWMNRDPIEEEDGLNLYAYVHGNPINTVDPDGLKAGNFSTAAEAGRAGAIADLMAASGGKIIRGALEFGGFVCKSKCGGATPYYYTGPTKGRKGPPPGGPNVDTHSNLADFPPCDPDETVGLHYAHPDGTAIPSFDMGKSRKFDLPFMLAIPLSVNTVKYTVLPYGAW
jgi:RHS repeat-associated protein